LLHRSCSSADSHCPTHPTPFPSNEQQVTQLLGRPPRRPFPGLAPAAAARTAPGAGLAVVPPPATATARGDLAFVALRLAAEACPAGRAALAAAGAAGEEGAEGGGKARRRRARNLNPLHALAAAGGAASSSSGAAAEEARLPPPLFRALHALTAATAQQFGGHVFRASEACGAHLLAFADVVGARRGGGWGGWLGCCGFGSIISRSSNIVVLSYLFRWSMFLFSDHLSLDVIF
jgi:hypothetical protein